MKLAEALRSLSTSCKCYKNITGVRDGVLCNAPVIMRLMLCLRNLDLFLL